MTNSTLRVSSNQILDKRTFCQIQQSVCSSTSCIPNSTSCIPNSTSCIPNSIPTVNTDKLPQRKRNLWSLVDDGKSTPPSNSSSDTPRFIENILNDNSVRYRDKLKAIQERMKGSTNHHLRCVDIPIKAIRLF